jgi:hypothetical protein
MMRRVLVQPSLTLMRRTLRKTTTPTGTTSRAQVAAARWRTRLARKVWCPESRGAEITTGNRTETLANAKTHRHTDSR